jgi:Transcriptional regulators
MITDAGEVHEPHAKQSLRLWLRMLGTTTIIEKAIRSHLRIQCDSTLPRFDALAALDRAGALTMGELSKRLLVSNGNVTGLVNRLAENDLIKRESDPRDRRSQRVSLTAAGRTAFRRMAKEHERIIDGIFADVSDAEMDRLLELIARLNKSVQEKVTPFTREN